MQTTEESACVFTVSMTGIRWWSSAPALHFQEVEQKYVEPASSSESTQRSAGSSVRESRHTQSSVQFPHGRTLAPQASKAARHWMCHMDTTSSSYWMCQTNWTFPGSEYNRNWFISYSWIQLSSSEIKNLFYWEVLDNKARILWYYSLKYLNIYGMDSCESLCRRSCFPEDEFLTMLSDCLSDFPNNYLMDCRQIWYKFTSHSGCIVITLAIPYYCQNVGYLFTA